MLGCRISALTLQTFRTLSEGTQAPQKTSRLSWNPRGRLGQDTNSPGRAKTKETCENEKSATAINRAAAICKATISSSANNSAISIISDVSLLLNYKPMQPMGKPWSRYAIARTSTQENYAKQWASRHIDKLKLLTPISSWSELLFKKSYEQANCHGFLHSRTVQTHNVQILLRLPEAQIWPLEIINHQTFTATWKLFCEVTQWQITYGFCDLLYAIALYIANQYSWHSLTWLRPLIPSRTTRS